ncbi:MAG TPA: methyltransferase domain-containing protein [Usitatibacter sp.]|jgi:ubiquinone/menaquinone biosynthesis C-methylase UbiE|nr:methyltransferase domain-containing protein [Usitatibacter sp.]
MDLARYHFLELQIASNPVDTRRVMPPVHAGYRRILDVGCGAGQTLVASSLGAQVTALGIDIDERALHLGRSIDPRIRYVQARGESLPLASGHFDLVISRVALPYMNQRAALAEMARVLEPGGTLWLALHPASQVIHQLRECVRQRDWRSALRRLYALANGAVFHLTGCEMPAPGKGRTRYESFQTPERMRRNLESLGFEDIRVERRGFFVVTATRKAAR